MKHVITLVPGDGIGPEVTTATTKVIEAAGIDVEWETIHAGAVALERHGTCLPDSLLESIGRNGVALKGPVTTPIGGGFTSINVTLRQQLRLYANVRPIRNLPEVKTRFGDVDLVVIRENTEDLYSGLEHVVVPGVVESLCRQEPGQSDRHDSLGGAPVPASGRVGKSAARALRR